MQQQAHALAELFGDGMFGGFLQSFVLKLRGDGALGIGKADFNCPVGGVGPYPAPAEVNGHEDEIGFFLFKLSKYADEVHHRRERASSGREIAGHDFEARTLYVGGGVDVAGADGFGVGEVG